MPLFWRTVLDAFIFRVKVMSTLMMEAVRSSKTVSNHHCMV